MKYREKKKLVNIVKYYLDSFIVVLVYNRIIKKMFSNFCKISLMFWIDCMSIEIWGRLLF